jgi:hypothetical protein
VEEKLEWVPEVLAIYLGSSGGDDEATECCDNDRQRTSNTLPEERRIGCLGITSPICSMSELVSTEQIMGNT